MAETLGTLDQAEIGKLVATSRAVITSATVHTSLGLALRASSPDAQYPYIDTRTLAAAIVALTELEDFRSARAFCSFLLGVQSQSGSWAAGYRDDGSELNLAGSEDATALAVWALMSYVRASGDDSFGEQAREHVEEAARYTHARTLNPYLYLVETTSSIHGPAISSGYELWNNCAHAAAYALCHRVYGGERHRRLALLIRRAIGVLMCAEGRFLRRLDPSGHPDPRPDVCLIAPFYFGLWASTERTVMNTAELIERTLWNVEIGGYLPYLPFSSAERARLVGPSPCFTAWMAQYHYETCNKDRGEAILRWLFNTAVDGQLAEVVVPVNAARRYLTEQRRSLGNGRVRKHDPRQQRLLADLDAIDEAVGHQEMVHSGVPLIWAHLELLRALRKAGYVQRWEPGISEALGVKSEE